MTLTYSNRNAAVTTTNMSIAAIPSIWLCKKIHRVGEAGHCRRIIYLPTVAWLTSIAGLSISP